MTAAINQSSKKRIYNFKWKDYNNFLIDKGDFTLFINIFDHYESELETINLKKIGRKFVYPNCIFAVCAIFRYLFHLPYRQLSGFLRPFAALYNFKVPHYDTIRRRILAIKLEDYLDTFDFSEKIISIAIDSTGLKLYANGEWLNKVHGIKNKTRKGWLKIHFATNVENHIVVAVEISDESVGDSKKALHLIDEARMKNITICEVLGDGAYDSKEIFNYCARNRIDPIIRIRKNFSTKSRGSPARAAVARVIDSYGLNYWKKLKQYGRRWSVERAYSVFKQMFGEYVVSHKFENQCIEVGQKVVILNYFLFHLDTIKI